MYVMLCTRPDICFAVGMVSKFQSNLGQAHWTAVKYILKYLKRTRDYMLVYPSDSLVHKLDFMSDKDSRSIPRDMCLPRRWSHSLEEYQAIVH